MFTINTTTTPDSPQLRNGIRLDRSKKRESPSGQPRCPPSNPQPRRPLPHLVVVCCTAATTADDTQLQSAVNGVRAYQRAAQSQSQHRTSNSESAPTWPRTHDRRSRKSAGAHANGPQRSQVNPTCVTTGCPTKHDAEKSQACDRESVHATRRMHRVRHTASANCPCGSTPDSRTHGSY